MKHENGSLVVIGSINYDRTQFVRALPTAGETVLALRETTGLGGKGANQAIAAARAGARVTMVGNVGCDEEGEAAVRILAENAVSVTGVHRVDRATGRASIAVDARGENTIIVVSGANAVPIDVGMAESAPSRPDVVVAQGELPPAGIRDAAELAKRNDARFVLNLAPFVDVPGEVLSAADPLIVNESEAAALLRLDARDLLDIPDAVRASAEILCLGARSAVVTLGGSGAIVAASGEAHHIPALEGVVVADTTGAGDAFVGAACAALSRGESLVAAVETGNIAGGLATTREGATRSYPTAEELAHAALRYRERRSRPTSTPIPVQEES